MLWSMDPLTLLLTMGVVAAIFWFAFRPRYEIMIRIRDGQPSLEQGKLRQQKWEEVARTCEEIGIDDGWIGVRHRADSSATFTFSRSIPPGSQQQLRNAWHVLPD